MHLLLPGEMLMDLLGYMHEGTCLHHPRFKFKLGLIHLADALTQATIQHVGADTWGKLGRRPRFDAVMEHTACKEFLGLCFEDCGPDLFVDDAHVGNRTPPKFEHLETPSRSRPPPNEGGISIEVQKPRVGRNIPGSFKRKGGHLNARQGTAKRRRKTGKQTSMRQRQIVAGTGSGWALRQTPARQKAHEDLEHGRGRQSIDLVSGTSGQRKGRAQHMGRQDLDDGRAETNDLCSDESLFSDIVAADAGKNIDPQKNKWCRGAFGKPTPQKAEDTGAVLRYVVRCQLLNSTGTALCGKTITLNKPGQGENWRGCASHLASRSHNINTQADLKRAVTKARQGPSAGAQKTLHTAFPDFSPIEYSRYSNPGKWSGMVDACCEFIASGNHPFRICSTRPFIEMIKFFDHRYPSDGISRKELTSNMQKMKESIDAEHLKEVQSGLWKESDIAFTADIWKSDANDHYLTVTMHYIDKSWDVKRKILGTMNFDESHTGDNIREKMREVRTQYGVWPRVAGVTECEMDDPGRREQFYELEHPYDHPTCTTDSGANIKAGIDLPSKGRSRGASIVKSCWDWNRCICHVLHLAVLAGLQATGVVWEDMKRLRKLCTTFKQSPKAWLCFRRIQERLLKAEFGTDLEIEECESDVEDESVHDDEAHHAVLPEQKRVLRMLRPVKTRWNSWYFCLRRALVLKTSLDEYLSKTVEDIGEIGWDEEDAQVKLDANWSISVRRWLSFKHLLDILEPIKFVSEVLEADTEVTVSVVMVCLTRLLYSTNIVSLDDADGGLCEVKTLFWGAFRKKLLETIDDVEQVFLWATCSALDGRHKHLDFLEHIWANPDDWPKVCKEYRSQHSFVKDVWDEIESQVCVGLPLNTESYIINIVN